MKAKERFRKAYNAALQTLKPRELALLAKHNECVVEAYRRYRKSK